jgi:uncharacterized spore protein YtfJ
MTIEELLTKARDSLSVRQVFAEPVTQDGTTVIAAALVVGGGGGGSGRDPSGETGQGGGFGLFARPVGAYVIKDGNVSWVPAVDVVRLAEIAGMATTAWMVRRAKRRRRHALKRLEPTP